MPQICGQLTHPRNALPDAQTDQSTEQQVRNYFRINVTISILDNVITNLQQRFSDGQDIITKGMALLPLYIITKPDWKTTLQPSLEFYSDEVIFVMLWILN